ncbi:hypothetical protein [Nocardioides pakistanensis]
MELTLTRKKAPGAADMTVQGGSVYTWPSAAKPSALLIPAYVREKRAAARTRKQVAAGVGVALAAIGAAVGGAAWLALQSTDALSAAQADRDQVKVQVDALADVAAYYDGIEARRSATLDHLSKDVEHATMLSQVLDSLPDGAEVTSYATRTGDQCSGPNPFEAMNTIGCVEMTATGPTEDTLPQFLRNLDRTDTKNVLLVAPFAANVVNDGGVTPEGAEENPFTFNVTINFTPEALSMKYVPKDQVDDVRAKVQEQSTEETP